MSKLLEVQHPLGQEVHPALVVRLELDHYQQHKGKVVIIVVVGEGPGRSMHTAARM